MSNNQYFSLETYFNEKVVFFKNIEGNLVGNVTGDVLGNLTGDVLGNVTGDVLGNLTGDVLGNVTGDVLGNVTGDVLGNVTGDVLGNLTGDVTGGISSFTSLNVSGVSTLSQVTETVINNFNSSLSPSSGTLTIDTSLGTVFLGDLNSSVTTWAFTNVPTTVGKAITVTLIIDGDASQTYGDACTVNGTSITNGIKWAGGNSQPSTNNYDIITFIIVRDNDNNVNVFGAQSMNYS